MKEFANSVIHLALAVFFFQARSMDYPGWDGFLGTRASFMLDVVCVGMIVVMSVLGWSIRQVRVRRNFQIHKRTQLVLVALLAVVLTLFEVDVRMNGWQHRATGSEGGEPSQAVLTALGIHLCFAISTVVLWGVVTFRALRGFPHPPLPNEHSAFHRRWGWIAAIAMLLTTISGWVFYVMAFVA